MNKSLEELRSDFPKFIVDDPVKGHSKLIMKPFMYTFVSIPMTDEYQYNDLAKKHAEIAEALRLMDMFPHLYISVDHYEDGLFASSVWVKRDGRDHESIHYGRMSEKDLAGYEKEASKACREGWFFCSGHVRAERKEEYSFFYYSGNYCKKYAEEHPNHRARAMSESYD